MADAELLRLLENGRLEVEGLLPWSSNYTFLVQICGDEEAVSAVYKPRRGERPLWDFPEGTLCARERAAFIVSEALHWQVTPPTVLRDGPHGLGSVQLFIEHDPEQHYFTFEGQPEYAAQLQKIVLFDVLINNADRKGGHVLREERAGQPNHLWAIDHGVCFHTDPKLRTVIWEFAGQPVAPDLLASLTQFYEDMAVDNGRLRTQLNELLTIQEVTALLHRLQRLVDRGIYPYPGSGRHYPWPPV